MTDFDALSAAPPDRIWVCDECFHVFTENPSDEEWGHPCPNAHPRNKPWRCESHLTEYALAPFVEVQP